MSNKKSKKKSNKNKYSGPKTAAEVTKAASELAEAAEETVTEAAETVEAAVEETAGAAKDAVEETMEEVAEAAAGVLETAESTVEETVKTVEETAVEETAAAAEDAVEETVEEVAEEAVEEAVETAPVPAIGASLEAPAKRKMRPAGKVLITVAAVIVVAFLALVLSNKLLIFRKGIYFSNAESIALPVTEKEVARLEKFTALKEADLSGSDCYKQIFEWASAHPEITVHYGVGLPEGASYDWSVQTADLSAFSRDEALAITDEHMQYIRNLKTVKLDLSKWSAEDLEGYSKAHPGWDLVGKLALNNEKAADFARLVESYPDVEFTGTVDIAGSPVTIGTDTAKISAPSQEAFDQLDLVLPCLPALKTVDFGTDEEGYSQLAEVYNYQQAHPELKVDYRFSYFDKIISMHAEKLDLHRRTMNDQGAAVREIIACMPDLTWLDMDTCNVDNEHMAAIRDDFPNIKVVWRVWLGRIYSVRTDVTKVLASAPETAGSLTPKTAEPLKYCTDIKYLDIGHNEDLKTIDFVQYMPNLEVFIVMWGDIHDISPLKNCTHLEFFEIFTNWITDLSPLSEMHELKHLNICHNPRLKDLSPIYGLTQLERLWIGTHTGIPKSQIAEFKQLAPDCVVNDTCGDAHTDWRGDHPRYLLLRQQMGYHYPEGPAEYQYYWNDPLYKQHEDLDLEWNSVKQ